MCAGSASDPLYCSMIDIRFDPSFCRSPDGSPATEAKRRKLNETTFHPSSLSPHRRPSVTYHRKTESPRKTHPTSRVSPTQTLRPPPSAAQHPPSSGDPSSRARSHRPPPLSGAPELSGRAGAPQLTAGMRTPVPLVSPVVSGFPMHNADQATLDTVSLGCCVSPDFPVLTFARAFDSSATPCRSKNNSGS